MKVLYLVTGVGPHSASGSDFIIDLIIKLSQQHIKATVISPIFKHTPPGFSTWKKKLQSQYDIKIITVSTPPLFSNNFLIQLIIIPFITTFAVMKILSQEKFDLIHEFTSTPIIAFRALLFRLFFSTPTIITHSVYNKTFLGRNFWFKIFDFANYYVVSSFLILRNLQKTKLDKQKLILIPPAINIKKFSQIPFSQSQARKKLKLPQNKFILSFYGPLVKEKGVQDIIDAISLLDQKTLTKILIVFFTKPSQRFTKTITIPHTQTCLVKTGLSDVPTILAASSATILPQQTGHGATIPPISIIESLLANKKTITYQSNIYHLPQTPQLFMIPTRHIHKLSQAIIKTINSPVKKINPISKKELLAYDLDEVSTKYLNLYDQINKK